MTTNEMRANRLIWGAVLHEEAAQRRPDGASAGSARRAARVLRTAAKRTYRGNR